MNTPAVVLALILFAGEVSTLVLRSGHHIPVDGPVELDNNTVIFRHPSGVLYSLPIFEVDVEATRRLVSSLDSGPPVVNRPPAEPQETRRLRVSAEKKEKLLRELEKSRGTPVPPRQLPRLETLVQESVDVRERDDEEYWRSEARRLEEQVRRRREDISMLQQRIRRLDDQVLTLLGIGVPPDQFAYQMMQLQDARDSVEEARLGLARAEREVDEFRDRARREGILPGWLR